MSPDRQALIDDLFVDALELPSEGVPAFLGRSTADPAIRSAVLDLLAQAHTARDAVAGAVGRAAAVWQAASSVPSLIGRRLGAYEITAVAGQGGMGAVYRARRADGQFEQDVAIKLVRHGYETPAALERFRQERQILARLTHPGIARLLDGGSAQDEAGRAVPYLVMEYVDGQPVTAYADATAMPTAGRMRLFRRVCEAVSHAHQQLVVHRDLKPGNILVTPAGEIKLLDFGIAKLLGDDGPALTRTGASALTPEYAAPEQVTGQPITVATDVYALGTILFELLTGQKAQRFENDSLAELTRVVCETTPRRPSEAVARAGGPRGRAIDHDLDTIVLRALQKEPARRYGSVEQLAEDLRRYLEGLPILARPDTFGYRAGKFIRRHAVATAAATLVALTLVTALFVTMREARARAIEASARQVEAQRAERRFQQVRKLANTFLFEIDGRISTLPGSGPARRFVIDTALEYLRSLSIDGDFTADPDRIEELATAYEHIGDLQATPGLEALSDPNAARENHRRARELRERLNRLTGTPGGATAALPLKVAASATGPAALAGAPGPSAVSRPSRGEPARAVGAATGHTSTTTGTHGMVHLAAGRVLLGSPPTEPGRSDRESPQHEVAVGSFWLDAREVTVGDFAGFVRARPEWARDRADATLVDPDYLAIWPATLTPPQPADLPVTWVSWFAAAAYCEWAGKRLPTEAEWEYAARAKTTTAYYWGDTWDPSKANATNHLAPAGLPEHANPWGLADMLGNAMEWTSTAFHPYPYDAADGRELPPSGDDRRVVRGGSYSLPPPYLRSAVRNSSSPPRLTSRVIGFRCAR